ncbi:MAG: DNA-directed RNA polymerase subunit L [Candidatus Aenigmatarchaeota archaeon]
MKLNILENSDNKANIEMIGESETLANLLRKNLWDVGVEQAVFIREHPYLSMPKIIVYGKNPMKALDNAAQRIIDQAKDFQIEFKRALAK